MAAPNLKEIEWKISELEQQESSWQSYEKLSILYTVRNEMLGLPAPQPQITMYSESAAPTKEPLGRYGDSEFLLAVEGLDPQVAWTVMDEHMDALHIVNPRAYESVMRKLRGV